MSIFHFLLVIKQNMNKWCRCFHKTTKKRISYLYICRCNTGKKSPNHIRSIAILLHCLYSRAPLNMYATFVLDLNWEFMLQVKNLDLPSSHYYQDRSDTIDLLEGWSGGAKVSCILSHRGVQMILAHSWASLAILGAGKGIGGMFYYYYYYFFCFFTFIPVPLSSLPLSLISSTISSIFFLPFSGRRHKMTHKG